MLVIRIWNYFRGYVIIKIEGLTLERFINLSIAKGIYLWDIVRLDYTTIQAKVGIKGFKELRDVVKRVGCRITIIDKKGYPFLIQKFKYRKMLAFGFVLALGIVFFLTSFIWSIEIIGNEKMEDVTILNYLKTLNIEEGIHKNKVDTEEIATRILTDIDDLSYAHAEIRGTKLIIEIKERDTVIEKIEEDVPCNIVAKKKAVIEKVVAKNGKSVVEKGDIVKEGEILISGIIKDERLENPLLVHCEGNVLGRTLYTKIVEEPIIKTINEETGRIHTAKEIKIFNKKIQLMEGEIPFKQYIEEVETKKILDKYIDILPIEITLHKYKEVNVTKIEQNLDSLKQITSVTGVQQLMEEIPEDAKVVSKDVSYSIEDNVLITKITVEVIEEIGIKEKIQFFEEE